MHRGEGYGAQEVEHAYARAHALCQQVGDIPQLIPVLQGLRRFYSARAEYQRVREIGEQLLHLAESLQDPVALVEGHLALGIFLWNPESSPRLAPTWNRGWRTTTPSSTAPWPSATGGTPEYQSIPSCRCSLAARLSEPGFATEPQAITLAQELSHAYSLALALSFAARLHQSRREGQAAQERAEARWRSGRSRDLRSTWRVGTMPARLGAGAQGQRETGMAQMRQGIAALQAAGAEGRRLYFLTLLAEAYGKVGQAEEGLMYWPRRWQPWRKPGNVSTNRSCTGSEGSYCGSRPCRTRPRPKPASSRPSPWPAASRPSRGSCGPQSLSRLWQQQGKRAEAQELLAPIYGWFTRALTHPTCRRRKAMLEELDA